MGRRLAQDPRLPPLLLNDQTEVLENNAPSWLVLSAKTRPFATARVELRLVTDGAGTQVTMVALVHLRNRRALNRLRRLAERGQAN